MDDNSEEEPMEWFDSITRSTETGPAMARRDGDFPQLTTMKTERVGGALDPLYTMMLIYGLYIDT